MRPRTYPVHRTITYVTHFCAAHRLRFHEGHCKNIHGHNYKVTVTLAGAEDPASPHAMGMVSDFAKMKEIVEPVIAEWDHKLLLIADDELIPCLQEHTDIVKLSMHPTAESMAQILLDRINEEIGNRCTRGMRGNLCLAVEVEESPGKAAKVALP